MISQLNSASVANAYLNNVGQNKANKEVGTQNATDKSQNRVEQLKSAIESGEYKIDLNALSKKMAEELL